MDRFLVFILVLLLSACNEEPVEVVKQENVDIIVYASGELESKQVAIIAPPSVSRMWQYQIKSIAPENTQVKKGQPLVSFDGKKVTERLVDKQAELAQAIKTLENKSIKESETEQELILAVAEKQMEFEKAKRRAEIIDNSRSEVERKKSEIDFTIAKNDLFLAKEKLTFHINSKALNLKRAQSKVDRLTTKTNSLKADLDRLNIKAPMDGMVIYRANWQGEKPAVGESIQFGQPVIELAVIEKMQLKAQITEPDSGKIAVGQTVKVTIDGNQKIVVQGKVESLGRVFRDLSFQDKRRIFDAIISLDTVDETIMRPGVTARVEVIVGQINDALTLPASVIKQDEGVYTVKTHGVTGLSEQEISIEQVVGNKVVIASGLSKGDEVAL